jgi:hypothetical protein
MPKHITHWILAEKAYLNIKGDSVLKKIIKSYKHLYLTGAVILDTPFFLLYGRDGKIMNCVAEKIHDAAHNSYIIFKDVIDAHERVMPDAVFSLLLGIITHIQADAVFHPFVYYFSGKGIADKKERACHHTLEAYLDLYFKEGFEIHNKGLFSEVVKQIEMEENAFREVLTTLFALERKSGMNMIKKAIKMNSFIQGLFDKNFPRILLQFLNFFPGMDLCDSISHFYPHPKPLPGIMFLHPFAYRHPVTGQKLKTSVDELAEQTVQQILEVFGVIEKNCSRKDSLAEVLRGLIGPNLYTGLPDVQKKDMHFFNTQKNIMELIFCTNCTSSNSG